MMGEYMVTHDDIDIINLVLNLPEEENIFDVEEDWESQFQRLGPIPLDIFQDIRQNDTTTHSKEAGVFQTTSPTSVLESRSSCLAVKSELLIPVRTRTKRPQISASSKWRLIAPSLPHNISNKKTKVKKKRKLIQISNDIENREFGRRICSHCQVTKTPQWRAGPKGPNTLCNACGVRYRCGSLFPEYRPASSPTFVPSIHSNSQRKILQMRNKYIQKSSMPKMNPAMFSMQTELLPKHDRQVGSRIIPEAFVPGKHPHAMSYFVQ